MGKKKQFNARSGSSYQRKLKQLPDRSGKRERCLVFSLRDFDRNQGQSFDDWQQDEILALALQRLAQISNLTLAQALSQRIIKVYTKVDFPPQSGFVHPKHIPNGVKWASFHIQGKECIIGHLQDEIFYIVFLDRDHQFWISTKKNT